jgi:hypothetical protein
LLWIFWKTKKNGKIETWESFSLIFTLTLVLTLKFCCNDKKRIDETTKYAFRFTPPIIHYRPILFSLHNIHFPPRPIIHSFPPSLRYSGNGKKRRRGEWIKNSLMLQPRYEYHSSLFPPILTFTSLTPSPTHHSLFPPIIAL